MSADTIVEQRTRPGSSFTRTSTSRQNSVRCGVPYSRFRAAAVRCDGRRRRKGGPRMPRDGQACRRGHRYVDTSFAVRGLRAGADYCFRVVTEGGASQPLTSAPRGPLEVSDVTRSSTTFSWLPQRRTAERRSWPTSSSSPEHPSPTWPHVARVRPQTTVYTVGNRVEWIDYQIRVCVENVEICQTDDPPDHFHGRRLVSPCYP